jgi:hypothetical protein
MSWKQVRTWALRGFVASLACAAGFLIGQVSLSTGFAQIPTNTVGGRLLFFTDALFGMRDNGDGSYHVFGPIFKLDLPPLTGWTVDNTGTFDTTNGYPYLSAGAKNATQIVGVYRTAPTAPYTCRALIYHDIAQGGLAGPPTGYGMGFRDGTGKWVTILNTQNVNYAGDPVMQSDKWTTAASYSANYKTVGPWQSGPDVVFRNPIWMWIKDDSTNVSFGTSLDKNHLITFDARSRTDFLTSGPTQVGFFAYSNGGGVELAISSWSCQ